MTEEGLGEINRGKMSRVLLENLKPELSHLRETAVLKLKHMYRDGSYTESKMLAAVAEICALDNLEDRLQGNTRRGEAAFKKEMENGERNT
jgi:hypothetical protein